MAPGTGFSWDGISAVRSSLESSMLPYSLPQILSLSVFPVHGWKAAKLLWGIHCRLWDFLIILFFFEEGIYRIYIVAIKEVLLTPWEGGCHICLEIKIIGVCVLSGDGCFGLACLGVSVTNVDPVKVIFMVSLTWIVNSSTSSFF